jgi:hypothetical protein
MKKLFGIILFVISLTSNAQNATMVGNGSHNVGIHTRSVFFGTDTAQRWKAFAGTKINTRFQLNKDSLLFQATNGPRTMLVIDTVTGSVHRMPIPSGGVADGNGIYDANGTATNRTVTVSGFLNFSGANTAVTAGTSTSFSKLGGVVWGSITSTATSGTGETDLHTYTTPANTLGNNGEFLEWETAGIINPSAVNDAGTITLRVYWAGTEIIETVSLSAVANPYSVKVKVVRTSSSNAVVKVEIIGGSFTSGLGGNYQLANVTTTFSNTNIIKLTLQASDADQGGNALTTDLKWFPQNL